MSTQKQLTIVCAIITNDKGEVLLTKRNDPGTSWHGKLEFPGGKIEFGEDPEVAVVREAKEESGFDVEVVRLLPKIYSSYYPVEPNDLEFPDTELQILIISYHCKIIGGEFKPDDREVMSGAFYQKDKIDYTNALRYCKEIVELLDN
ncbi:MAG: NUDIX domain-containing protein [Candidatus Doudnabacteria bacterium]